MRLHVGAVTVTIAGVTIRNGGAGEGGGLHLGGGAVFITDCVIAGNQAGSGAGIYQAAGAATIERTTIDGNRAGAFGRRDYGGGRVDADRRQRHHKQRSRTQRLRARSRWRGRYSPPPISTTIHNVTISGNKGYDGGGIMVVGPTRVFNSTITSNGAAGVNEFVPGQGGGVSGGSDLFSFQNTILAGNYETYWEFFPVRGPDSRVNDCRGSLLSEGNNLIGTVSDCTVTGPVRLVTNLGLGPLQDNGGPTATHALLPGSDAIDGGAPGGCRDALGSPIVTDQRGAPRPFGAACDIGAFESTACTSTRFGAASVLRIPETGSSAELPVLPNDGRCAWSAASSTAWIVVTAGSSGSGNGTVALHRVAQSRRRSTRVDDHSRTVLHGAASLA